MISSPASAIDLAGLGVIEVFGEILAVEIGVGGAERLQALLGELPGGARGQLAAGLDRDFAGVGVDEIVDDLARPSCARDRRARASRPCRAYRSTFL